MRYRIVLGGLLCLLTLPLIAGAQDLAMHDFSYLADFEDGKDPVVRWVTNGEYEINFKGVTDEKAFSGDKSFKLDVTLKSGSYHYWSCPVRVPCGGELKFSARMLLDEGTNGKAALGANFVFPPSSHSGVGTWGSQDGPTGEWKLVEGDLCAQGQASADGVLPRYVDGATGQNVGVYVDRWGIFIYGGGGKRVVLYVDDVRIEGKVPEDEAYKTEYSARWKPFADAFKQRTASWRERAQAAEQAMAGLPELPEAYAAARDTAAKALARVQERLGEFEARGYAHPQDVSQLQSELRMVELAPKTFAALAQGIEGAKPFLLMEVPAISNARILSSGFLIPGEETDGLSVSACRGEYEAVSFVVYALADLKGLLLTPTDLSSGGRTIPAENVDIKLIKCWYQAGRSIGDLKHKQLVPELLLNDDALVRVDEQTQTNNLRTTYPDGTTAYVVCSDKESAELEGVRPVDADSLQPVNIPATGLQQYWVTVHVPEDAAAGDYEGRLQLTADDIETVQLPLKVTVRPFDLEPSPLIYSIYYRGKLSEDGSFTIGSEYKSEEQYAAEMRDFHAHGVEYPTVYQKYDERLLPRVFEIRKEAGLATDKLFTLGCSTGAPTDEAGLNALRERVRTWLTMARQHGYEEMYCYGIDEARGERLEAQRNAWKAVQEEGAGTFVACYKGTFEAMGSLLNVAVLAGKPDPKEAERFHGVGSKVFTYAFPQVGPEEPETYRRNFGLVLWQAGFDGAMDYAYQHGFGHVWNDFDSDRYRDHNFTYPTVNGVVDTVQWEGFREGVDDVRYMATLLKAVEECKDAAAKAEAQAWITNLDPQRDLYEVRAEMVGHILKCLGLTR